MPEDMLDRMPEDRQKERHGVDHPKQHEAK